MSEDIKNNNGGFIVLGIIHKMVELHDLEKKEPILYKIAEKQVKQFFKLGKKHEEQLR